MSKKILIITPSAGFGELIRQALEAHGDFQGTLAVDGKQARAAIATGDSELLILDAELGLEASNRIVELFRDSGNPGPIVLIPPEDKYQMTILDNLAFDQVLGNPFYLPDLLEAIDEVFGQSLPESPLPQDAASTAPPILKPDRLASKAPEWIEDVQLAAQYLMRLSLESAAQAALIIYKDQIWAYSGELSQPAAETLVGEIRAQWDQEAITDIARFVHLDETESDYMLYATSLGGHYALALVFDTQIPFTKMRQQASALAASLAKAPAMHVFEQAQDSQEKGEGDHLASGVKQEFLQGENDSRDFLSDGARAEHLPENEGNPEENRVSAKKLSDGLRFSFMLIPRFPHHYLNGELREQISIWLPQMCVAFAWRLEHFQIRAESLMWTVQIGADQSPDSVANIMAEQLSERIFDGFPRFARENPSRQFWATGALIVSGDQISQKTIESYIRDTRASQGINL